MPARHEARPRLSKYKSKGAAIYFALVLPAIILEITFSVAVTSTPGGLVSVGAGYGAALASSTQLAPWLLLAASIYAVLSLRPSLLVVLLITSFFVGVSVANGMTVLGARLDLTYTVILVILASFLALAGFNFARGLKLLDGRLPEAYSSGPVGYNVLSVALEAAIPLAVALALVLVVQTILGALGTQSARLPPPLSTLTSLYLQTRIGLVFTTLFVAGAAIWVLRQFIEPVILHFTLTPSDARNELLSEIEPTTKSVGKIARYRPSSGLAWGFLTAAYCVGVITALAIFLPRDQLSRDLLDILSLHTSSPSTFELLLQNSFQNGIVKADILFAQSQDYLREIIRLLWG